MSAHERERLSAYLDGELAPADAATVEAHLAACAECAGFLEALAAVDERFREAPVEAPAGYFDGFAARVRARVEAEPRRRSRRLPAWSWAVAAALLLAVVTPLTLRSRVAVPPAAEVPAVAPAPRAAEPGPAGLETPPRRAAAPAALEAVKEQAATPAPPPRQKTEAQPAGALEKKGRGQAVGETAANETDLRDAATGGVVGGVVGGEPGGLVGAVVGGEPDAPPLPAAPVAAPTSADREGAPAAFGTAASGGARTKSTGALRRADAAPASEAVAEERGGTSLAFDRLEAAVPRTAAEWRLARDGWRAFAEAHPRDPRADEARVRALVAALEALRASGDAADRRVFDADAAGYLAREDAAQKDRVRALVRQAGALPR